MSLEFIVNHLVDLLLKESCLLFIESRLLVKGCA